MRVRVEGARAFVSLVELAREIEVHETTLRRLVWSGSVFAQKRAGSKGDEIDVLTLPAKHKAAYIALHPELSSLAVTHSNHRSLRYVAARESVRKRAIDRLEAVLSLQEARGLRAPGEKVGVADERWSRNFTRAHPEWGISLRSVRRWLSAYEAIGLDGLVDNNDGEKTRGARIPEWAEQRFRDWYLRAHSPNLRSAYDSIVIYGKQHGHGSAPCYETFRRFAKTEISEMARMLHREKADSPRSVLPHVPRDPMSIPAYHTLQFDERTLDIPVRCDRGCAVCAPAVDIKGRKVQATGHFPVWSVWCDIHSRRIMTSDLSVEPSNYKVLLRSVKRLITEHGLMKRLYVDNAPHNQRALGKQVRRIQRAVDALPTEPEFNLRFAPLGIKVVYAIAYNAQAKLIERLFRSFRMRFDELYPGFRGKVYKRSELAKELYRTPHELPTLSEVAEMLRGEVARYNDEIPHQGRGMNKRTPTEVFNVPGARIPRQDPDPKALQLIFFEPIGTRIVGPMGIRYNKQTYRLTSLEKQFYYFASQVEVRIDPEGERTAALFDVETGAYVCDAILDDSPATYLSTDILTQYRIHQMFAESRDLKRRAAGLITPGSKERLAETLRARFDYYRNLIANERALAGASGTGTTLFVPDLSAVARDREAALASIDMLVPATASALSDVADGEVLTDDDRIVVEQLRKQQQHKCEIDFCNDEVGASGFLCVAHEGVTGWRPPALTDLSS